MAKSNRLPKLPPVPAPGTVRKWTYTSSKGVKQYEDFAIVNGRYVKVTKTGNIGNPRAHGLSAHAIEQQRVFGLKKPCFVSIQNPGEMTHLKPKSTMAIKPSDTQQQEWSQWNGTGTGQFRYGDRVTSLNGIKKGDIFIDVSTQFGAVNVIKVLSVQDDKLYVIFVNPDNPKKLRLPDDRQWVIWHWDIKEDAPGMKLYQAIKE